MKMVQILGTGCPKCKKLAANTEEAAQILGEEIQLEKVTDLNDIMKFGCMTTPGLAIEGQLVSQGKLLQTDQIMALLRPFNNQ